MILGFSITINELDCPLPIELKSGISSPKGNICGCYYYPFETLKESESESDPIDEERYCYLCSFGD